MLSKLKRIARRVANRPVRSRALAGLSESERALIDRVRAKKLTYLSERKLASLAATCRGLERDGIEGVFIEAGCALGGSAILVASIKAPDRKFNVYDVFGMIPPPTAEDPQDVHQRYREIAAGKSKGLGGDEYYGYQTNLYEAVASNLNDFGINLESGRISLIKGLVQDTLFLDGPVAFAHVDVDWYEPVMTCLTRIYPKLSVGGCMILDDYQDWGGCRKAADEYLSGRDGSIRRDDSAGSLKITKLKTD